MIRNLAACHVHSLRHSGDDHCHIETCTCRHRHGSRCALVSAALCQPLISVTRQDRESDSTAHAGRWGTLNLSWGKRGIRWTAPLRCAAWS